MKKVHGKKGRIGSSFDDFLKEDGIYEGVTARDVLSAGHSVSGVDAVLSVDELAQRTRDEYRLASARIDLR